MSCCGGQGGKKGKLKRQATKKGIAVKSDSPAGKAAEAKPDLHFDPSAHSHSQEDVVAVPTMSIGFATDLGFHHESNEDTSHVIEDLFEDKKPAGEYVGTTTKKVSLFSIFDGHGGPACSAFVRDKVGTDLANLLWKANYDDMVEPAFLDVFAKTEAEFLNLCRESGELSGSCGTAVLVKGTKIFCANAGDSKAMVFQVSKSNKPMNKVDLNERHGTELKSERKRILKAGGHIHADGSINGVLFPSRGFGDLDVKADGRPVVIAVPVGYGISPQHPYTLDTGVTTYLIVASDGLWDFASDELIMSTVLKGTRSEKQISEALIREARMGGSEDDVTVITVKITFPPK